MNVRRSWVHLFVLAALTVLTSGCNAILGNEPHELSTASESGSNDGGARDATDGAREAFDGRSNPPPDASNSQTADGADIPCTPMFKRCGGQCVSIDDPKYGCGAASCDSSSCPDAGSGGLVCQSGSCVVGDCPEGTKICSGMCVSTSDPNFGCASAACDKTACPDAGAATLTCQMGSCVIGACPSGTKNCGGQCVSIDDPTFGCGATTCDSSSCPAKGTATLACQGGACVIGTCGAATKKCGGKCVSVDDPTYGCGATTCDATSCPAPGLGTLVCQGGACVVGTCGTGTKKCGSQCVPLDANHGCGDPAVCTACASNQTCTGSPTTHCACVPDNTTACANKTCGSVSNNCGTVVSCGTCIAPQTCQGGGVPNICGCTPTNPCTGGKCGMLGDGCGGTVNCSCSGTSSCGGGGVAGVCGCTPMSMAAVCAGGKCGKFGDGCGGTVTCTCAAGLTCGGGGGPANVCGCSPITTCTGSQKCGTQSNGCGGMISCGTCGTNQMCNSSGQCVSTCPTTCPAGDNCGTVTQGTCPAVSCGTCSGLNQCGKGTPSNPNVCGCTPITACTGGRQCGTQPNGCGGNNVPCGNCGTNQTCDTGTGRCVSTCPTTCPAGDNCGTFIQGTCPAVPCGTCTGSNKCGGGTPSNPNVCGCTPVNPCNGTACGSFSNGCGTNVTCGCSGQLSCVNGACGCPSSIVQCGTACCTAASPPNQKPFCTNSGVCGNQCIGSTLHCSDGAAVCGSWGFESNTAEGWQGVAAFDLNAFFGGAAPSTKFHSAGKLSFMLPFAPGGSPPSPNATGSMGATVPICSGDNGIDLTGHSITVDVFLEGVAFDPANPAPGLSLTVGSNTSENVSPAINQWFTLRGGGSAGTTSITVNITAVGWYNIYIDNVQII